MDRRVVIERGFMAAPHPIKLRERAVRAYVDGKESMLLVAARFQVAPRALRRWLKQHEKTGSVAPKPRGGGNRSPIDPVRRAAAVVELGDAITHELTVACNHRVRRSLRVHRSSIQRALRRGGYVFKKKAQTLRARAARRPAQARQLHPADEEDRPRTARFPR